MYWNIFIYIKLKYDNFADGGCYLVFLSRVLLVDKWLRERQGTIKIDFMKIYFTSLTGVVKPFFKTQFFLVDSVA